MNDDIIKKYREHSKCGLERMVYDYYAGGSADEITLQRNKSVYKEFFVVDRNHNSENRSVSKQMDDPIEPTTTIKIHDRLISVPILLSPTAMQRMADREFGELSAGNVPYNHKSCDEL